MAAGRVRRAAEQAREIGHWRRLLLLYGQHDGSCAAVLPVDPRPECDCGFAQVFDPLTTNVVSENSGAGEAGGLMALPEKPKCAICSGAHATAVCTNDC